MTYYALQDSDWSFTDTDEGQPIIVWAENPQEAVLIATRELVKDESSGGGYSIGIHWKICELRLVGFQSADWDSSTDTIATEEFQEFSE